MGGETFLVTGSTGCIGSWVLRNLVRQGVRTLAGHTSSDFHRPGHLLSPEEMGRVKFVRFDIGRPEPLFELIEKEGVTRIIHLAGLQVPFCKADPGRGAWVNVLGMVNVLEAVRKFSGQIKGFSYASSVAVLGPEERYPQRPVPDQAQLWPETIYGAYKMADEHLARIFWQDWQVPSLGLRPAISYGVGRDQGLTSDISKAILAAAVGRPFNINFSGLVSLQYNDDLAKIFIAAALSGHQGAPACNLRNDVLRVSEFVDLLRKLSPTGAAITYSPDSPLPFPFDLDDAGIRSILGRVDHTPLETAVSESLALYARLAQEGEIDLKQID